MRGQIGLCPAQSIPNLPKVPVKVQTYQLVCAEHVSDCAGWKSEGSDDQAAGVAGTVRAARRYLTLEVHSSIGADSMGRSSPQPKTCGGDAIISAPTGVSCTNRQTKHSAPICSKIYEV